MSRLHPFARQKPRPPAGAGVHFVDSEWVKVTIRSSMVFPEHSSCLIHPQYSVEHGNISSPHPSADLNSRLHPKSNESGTERWVGGGGWVGAWRSRWGRFDRCAYRFIIPASYLSGLETEREGGEPGVIWNSCETCWFRKGIHAEEWLECLCKDLMWTMVNI